MTVPLDILYTWALILIACTCVLGVFSPHFDDTLTQRVGMAMVCLGCVAALWRVTTGIHIETPRYLVIFGLAVYCFGSVAKRLPRPWDSDRRASDRARLYQIAASADGLMLEQDPVTQARRAPCEKQLHSLPPA